MGRVVPLVLVFAASGCEIIDDLGDPVGSGKVDVEVETRDGVAEISWNRDDAWTVSVIACESDCGCNGGHYSANGTVVWTVGYDDKAFDPVQEPPIRSPLTYGDEEIPGNALDAPAMPLEPGRTYGVEVDVGRRRLEGCTAFVMDEN